MLLLLLLLFNKYEYLCSVVYIYLVLDWLNLKHMPKLRTVTSSSVKSHLPYCRPPMFLSLVGAMKQSVIDDDDVAVIQDKYPKAKYHFLILPKNDTNNLRGVESLKRDHIEMLKKMVTISENLMTRYIQPADIACANCFTYWFFLFHSEKLPLSVTKWASIQFQA